MSYKGPKAKLSRALGVALTRKAAHVMNRKPNPPGQHGNGRKRAKSNYGEQLLEKQRLRFQYNVNEKQLRKYFKTALRRKGNTGSALLQILESRLDNMVYRAGFAPTIYAARQLVSHGHIRVDGKKVDRPSLRTGIGQLVQLSEKAKGMDICQRARADATVPAYVDSDAGQYIASMTREPQVDEIPIICRTQMVVEFYSR